MNSIKINVISDNGTTIGSLDVSDQDLNIIYQLSDIREPDKRKANYVRQFKLPGTKNNNRIFSNIFENGYQVSELTSGVPTSKTYNPNLKLIAQVILNSNIFFEGNLQLNKIEKVDNKLIGYEVTIYGSLGDFFGDIGDSDMVSLDISEYNHKLTRKNIAYSWNMRGEGKYMTETLPGDVPYNKFFKDYVWKYNILTPNDIGDGYVYPLIYQGGSDLNTYVSVDKWAPSTYVYTLMRKIFDKWGWKWKSEFFESELFKRLIVPFSKDSLMITEAQKDLSEFLANAGQRTGANAQVLTQHTSAVANTQTSTKIQFIYDSTTPSPQPYPIAQPAGRDTGNSFNTSTGIWTCPKNGNFSIQSKVHMMIGFLQLSLGGSGVAYGIPGPNVPFKLKLINADTNAVLAEKAGEWVFNPTVKTFGDYYQTVPCVVDYTGFIAVGTKLAVIAETTIPTGQFASKTINLSSGVAFNCPIKTYAMSFVNDAAYISATLQDKKLQEGDDVDMNQTLPEMSIKDFIVGINKMFNLYWVPTGNEKEFIIEPRDTLFEKSSGKILDWTKYVENGEVISIEPLYDLTANKYKYTYKSDSDYLNKDYEDTNNGIYGDKFVSIENDFQTSEQKVETNFSPSPLYTPTFNSQITLTAFISQDGDKFKRMTPKPRILYWGGMKSYDGTTATIDDKFGNSGVWSMQKKNTDGTFQKSFPYAGHLDDTKSPTLDLNYGICKSYYFTFNTLTDNTLYNNYWKSFTEELIDPNQHLLTCQLYLPGMLMMNLDLRSVIQVDNVYYRINKVTYNPWTSLAEAELFKLKSYVRFEPSYITTGSLPSQPNGTGNTGYVGGWGTWLGSYGVKPWTSGMKPYVNGRTRWSEVIMNGDNNPQWSPVANVSGNWTTNLDTFDGIRLPTQPRTSLINGTNTYSKSGSISVNGEWNRIEPTAQFITVNGSFNNITSGVRNATIVGDYNTILPDVVNVSIVGNNIVANKSNTSYVDGLEIGKGQVQTHSTNMVKSPTTLVGGVVMGGKNSVGAFSTRKTTKVVIGNAPTSIQPKNASPLGTLPPFWNGMINLA